MPFDALLVSIVGVPVLGSFFLPLAGRIHERLRHFLAFSLVAFSFLAAIRLSPVVFSGQVVRFSMAMPFGLHLAFAADGLAVFMALASLLVGLVIVLYSFDYIAHYANRNEYDMLVVLFLGSMMGIVFSSNLIFLYIFWEMTAIVSWRLIGFFRGKTDVQRADKAFLVTFGGALVMLIGFLILYQQTGSFDLWVIK